MFQRYRMLKLKKFRENTRSDQKYKIMAVLEVLGVLAVQAVLAIFHFINYATEWLVTYYFLQIM